MYIYAYMYTYIYKYIYMFICIYMPVFHYFQYGTYCQSVACLPRFTLHQHMALHAVTRINQNMVSFDTISLS